MAELEALEDTLVDDVIQTMDPADYAALTLIAMARLQENLI